jgi:DNA polymerase elongation subunit (family B)
MPHTAEATARLDSPVSSRGDAWLFGWDLLPGIVSVWADYGGHALIWQRRGDEVRCLQDRFRPWLFAAGLDDLRHLGPSLVEQDREDVGGAPFSYRLLDGPPGSLRYLLSAHDGRALQQAILEGASRRLGRRIAHIRDLPETYYMVGVVEQYLMATGRVLFRGMAYSDLHRLQVDLETTALSPRHGRIFMAAVRDSHGLGVVLEAPEEADEAALITDLCALIRARDPDVIENHNLFGFDLPFLVGRAAALGLPLRLGRGEHAPLLAQHDEPAAWGRGRRTRYSVAGRELIDTLDSVRRHDFVVRDMQGHGLKAAARYFGLAALDRTYLPGPEIYHTYRTDPARVRRYALDDVTEVDGLSQRLQGAAFALAGMAPRRYERVAAAGPATGILEPLLVRAYLRAGVALPVGAADVEPMMAPHQGGATILYAAGVARRVVKADIASMYPSIMRTFRIGPACDSLGALLYLVDRLAELRLHHKQLARQATAGSAEAQSHDALQAAMKIVINAAYGYMGAGRMALFADRAAADAVTRRGREILGQVAERLRAQGTVLLEADTDGVFFAVPEHWSEADERACVAAVATTLPSGIRLEYEGRYQAMLSHEVKNYALLAYDGRLITRGAALHSSRSEPFGERFLRAALLCTLTGDAAGVQAAYLETVAALRERRFSPGDVATVARLTKSAAEYARTRERAREAAYEALLAAGRQRWSAGERVRFYRAAGGAAVWLPEEPERDLARAEDAGAGEEPARALPPYDVAHYLDVLHTSYVSRLRKAFASDDFEQLFRPSGQAGLFDRPLSALQPLWIQAIPPGPGALAEVTDPCAAGYGSAGE